MIKKQRLEVRNVIVSIENMNDLNEYAKVEKSLKKLYQKSIIDGKTYLILNNKMVRRKKKLFKPIE